MTCEECDEVTDGEGLCEECAERLNRLDDLGYI